ncbi:MAG TPA: S8 family serine peptidase, partial [Symbiobacteriaceae bacterium]|nr:S8 family serine peptidase [Symbiobacteriaceae bacterium]
MRTRFMTILVTIFSLVLVSWTSANTAAAVTAPSRHMPGFIRNWYGVSQLSYTGSGQTVAIIGAGDYENAAADLETHIQAYGLASMNGLPGTDPCTIAEGPYPCFERAKAPASGVDPAPLYWSGGTAYHLEAASDIQWAHVIAPGANILFVDAATPQPDDMLTAVDTAVEAGASVVSMSFGWVQTEADLAREAHFAGKPGVVFVAASGDRFYDGKLLYPAASPHVLSVGGTTLKM